MDMPEAVMETTTVQNLQISAILEALKPGVTYKRVHLDHDLRQLKIMKQLLSPTASIRVMRTASDETFLKDLKAFRICRRILGKEMLDRFKRKFEFKIKGRRHEIFISPTYMAHPAHV